jgi:hypothetical protein
MEELRSPTPVPSLACAADALAPPVRPDGAEVAPVAAACPAAPLRVKLNGDQVAEHGDGADYDAEYGWRSDHNNDRGNNPPESIFAGNHMIKMTYPASSVHHYSTATSANRRCRSAHAEV